MSNKNKKISEYRAVGTVFETVAEIMLSEKGYKILERNYIYGKYEIDLIVKKEKEIAFVEVKSRNERSYLSPESNVGSKKMRNILYCAAAYIKFLSSAGIDVSKFSYSFDVVGILYTDDYDLKSIRYFKNYYKGDKYELLRFAL